MKRVTLAVVCAAFLLAGAASSPAGEIIPQAELQALDRAISRELNSGHLGSQTLGDLTRLKNRLRRIQAEGLPGAAPALDPGDAGDGQRLLQRLETEAQTGGRAARRSLALYYIFLNEPEKAMAQWRQMGRSSDFDVSHHLVSAYLEFALSEYDAGRRSLETALRLMESRTSLVLGAPVFCQTVAGYRVYVERPQGNLLPGEDVLVYIEVEGVEFATTPEKDSACDLMFGLKLKNDSQSTIWAESNYGQYAPIFAGPIRDLHAALTWRVPNDLDPGRYHLHVEVVEDSTKRRGESVIGFNVGKRETNPERSPVQGLDPAMRRQMEEANRMFPGAATPEIEGMRGSEFFKDKQFELLQEYYQKQKVDR